MEATIHSLHRLLLSMPAPERADLVAGHPSAWARPRPQTVHQLAARLIGKTRVRADALVQSELQLMEAAVVLADRPRRSNEPVWCERSALERLLGVGEAVTGQRVAEVLASLARRVLAWPDGERVVLHPDASTLFVTPLDRPPYGNPPLPERAPLVAARPVPVTRPVSDHKAAVAGGTALQQVDRLVEVFRQAWPALKQGGISVRDVRRLGRLLYCPEPEARLWLHLAVGLGLIDESYGRWKCTKRANGWCAATPAARLAHLVGVLRHLDALPLLDLPDLSRPYQAAPALSSGATLTDAAMLRRTVLSVLAELPAGQGALAGPEMAAAVYYRSPTAFAPYGDAHPSGGGNTASSARRPWYGSALQADAVTAAVLGEAELLGLTADGALTDLGRAWLEGDDGEQLEEAAAGALPLHEQASVLADHVVLVPGVPTAALAAVLEAVCDLERRDAHSQTWRITPSSVRRYYDRVPGADPHVLLRELEAVSTTPIPQTVAYMITDTAKRHGHINVTAAQAVLDVRHEGLAAELVHHRDLRGLGLRRVAPTVLVATADMDKVLEQLRAAGYAPAGPQHSPAAASEQGEAEVYVPPQRGRVRSAVGLPKDFRGWLIALPEDETGDETGEMAQRIRRAAPALGAADCATLAAAIETGSRIHVEYRTASRMHTSLVMDGPQLSGGDRLTGKTASWSLPLSLHDLQLVLPAPPTKARKKPG